MPGSLSIWYQVQRQGPASIHEFYSLLFKNVPPQRNQKWSMPPQGEREGAGSSRPMGPSSPCGPSSGLQILSSVCLAVLTLCPPTCGNKAVSLSLAGSLTEPGLLGDGAPQG